ncbi:uncharacterized protein LOC121259962 [Juglans microcarpa x Juglans regia]|uniref:uncharacterized protein LOC121259962 n=1 Tax=Juglans microcarpa x Juglans regia TaxID=2249226 RepID=UPI001B7DE32A|nr:uncharacterized protein LOC121259962 [Juglans microcarpa x Juglans regia]
MLLTILSGWLFVEKRKLVQLFPEPVRKLWNDWELRIMVLISLTLQILLIVMGNRRKYNPGTWLRFSIWSAYLMADWVATVALGVLSNKQGNSCTCAANKTETIDEELMAFWAPFLLLHLGGPDTITAYALADNELWIRHFLGLVVQTLVALYVTVTAWSGTWLSFLTIPMLVTGVIKYGERSLALRSANREQFLDSLLEPPDPGPNYAKFMEEFTLKKCEGFSVLAIEVIEEADQSRARNVNNNGAANSRTLLLSAYNFFQTFKRLFVDLILSFQDRDHSQSYFKDLSSEDGFKLVEIELGFAYDVFYTKAPIIYTTWGCIFRFISPSLTIIVLGVFQFVDKGNHLMTDLAITYILLIGAIILEFYAVILLLYSDRTKLWWSKHEFPFSPKICCFGSLVSRLISFFKPILSRLISGFQCMVSPVSKFFPPMVSRMFSYSLPSNKMKWSNSLAQYNLLSFALQDNLVPCLEDKCHLFLKIVKHIPPLEKRLHRYHCNISPELKSWIFKHFLRKSKDTTEKDNKEKSEEVIASLCRARGNLVFEQNNCFPSFKWTTELEFDQSILVWHVATDLCYHSDGVKDLAVKSWSKNLSDYMLYLLVMCPFMLPIGIGMIRFRDTCEEAKQFYKEKGLSFKDKSHKTKLCKMLLEVSTEVLPTKVKGDRSKSVLFNGCRLARELLEMDREKKWEFVCDVWIEMLGYSASQCRGYYHAQQLMKGGELLTHVWLLMAHLGITQQFQINRGHARAKLAVY